MPLLLKAATPKKRGKDLLVVKDVSVTITVSLQVPYIIWYPVSSPFLLLQLNVFHVSVKLQEETLSDKFCTASGTNVKIHECILKQATVVPAIKVLVENVVVLVPTSFIAVRLHKTSLFSSKSVIIFLVISVLSLNIVVSFIILQFILALHCRV